jgi:hypothetical protein
MVSLDPNPIKMRSNFPLVTKGYPLSGGKLIKNKNGIPTLARTEEEGQLPS